MKKLLLLTIIALITFSSYSQDSTKLTVKQVYEDAKTGITKLVENLGGPAKHVYRVYLYQHKAEGIALMVLPIILLCFSVPLIGKNYKKADFEEGNKAAFASGAGVMIGLASMILIITFFAGDGFTKMINPEYFAIQDIIKAFK